MPPRDKDPVDVDTAKQSTVVQPVVVPRAGIDISAAATGQQVENGDVSTAVAADGSVATGSSLVGQQASDKGSLAGGATSEKGLADLDRGLFARSGHAVAFDVDAMAQTDAHLAVAFLDWGEIGQEQETTAGRSWELALEQGSSLGLLAAPGSPFFFRAGSGGLGWLQGPGPVGGLLPFDEDALEQGVQRFFAEVESIGEAIVEEAFVSHLGPWLVGTAATMGAALCLAHRLHQGGRPDGRRLAWFYPAAPLGLNDLS
jgi:hypothetical protein